MAGFPWIGAGFVRAGWRVEGPGGSPAARGAGGVLDVPAREPIMAGAGKGRGRLQGYAVMGAPSRLSGWQACWLPSSLRVCPGLAGRGAWGGSRPGTGGANHISVPAAGPVARLRNPYAIEDAPGGCSTVPRNDGDRGVGCPASRSATLPCWCSLIQPGS